MNKNFSAIREAGCKISFGVNMNFQRERVCVKHLRIQSLATKKILGYSDVGKAGIIFDEERTKNDVENAAPGSLFDLAMTAAIENCNATLKATIARILALKEAEELAASVAHPQPDPGRKSGRL